MTDPFKIFDPFKTVNKNSHVIITSWGTAGTNKLGDVVNNVSRAKKVQFLVGYSKETHDLEKLKQILMYYKKLGWIVKVMPGFHSKIWIINDKAWIGSCNWFQNTVNNYMHQTKITPRLNNFIKEWWGKSYNINEGSILSKFSQK